MQVLAHGPTNFLMVGQVIGVELYRWPVLFKHWEAKKFTTVCTIQTVYRIHFDEINLHRPRTPQRPHLLQPNPPTRPPSPKPPANTHPEHTQTKTPTMAGGHMKYRQLGRDSAHRQALLRNLVTSLIKDESIHTTWHKAKEAQRLAERLITHAKKNTEASRRRAQGILYVRPPPRSPLPTLWRR